MTVPAASGGRTFSADVLRIDAETESARIADAMREQVVKILRRRGVVLGLSGGIDSSVTAALAVRALGPERVVGLLMPETDSSDDSLRLGQLVADHFGIRTFVEDVTATLAAAGCYRRRDDAIRMAVPEYTTDHRSKLVMTGGAYRVFSIVVEGPDGRQVTARLPLDAYLGVVAATNFKQRVRKMMEYYYADVLQYAVAGTPNRLEFDQGFFVKNGDGSADLKPIAHLYKSQVYELARHLGVPDVICARRPTTDTFSLGQSQEEFFFSLPLEQFDLCLYAHTHGLPAAVVAPALGLPVGDVDHVFRDIDATRKATRYQHARPLLVEPVASVTA